MNTEPLDPTFRAWLEEGPTAGPESTLRAALARVEATVQRPALLAGLSAGGMATGQGQARPGFWPKPGSRLQMVVAVATVILLVAVAGAVVVMSGIRPDPGPVPAPSIPPITETSNGFLETFEYTIPAGAPMTVTAAHFGIYRFTGEDGGVDVFWNSGYIHPCTPGEPDPYADYLGAPSSGIPSSGLPTTTVGSRPEEFLSNLGRWGNVGIGEITPTTVGDLPAFMTTVDPALHGCEGMLIHTSSGGCSGTINCEIRLVRPARLIATTVDTELQGRIGIGVMIWAEDWEALDAWLPVADELVQSLRFGQSPGRDPR